MPEPAIYAPQFAVVCASPDCDNELDPTPGLRHIDNLLAAGWTCTQCRRSTAALASFDEEGAGLQHSRALSPQVRVADLGVQEVPC